ncbi:MAG: superoxide dismutase family protein [Parachlamydiaceae bacterium]
MKKKFVLSNSLLCRLLSCSLFALTLTSCACTDNRKPEVKHGNENQDKSADVAQVVTLESPKRVIRKAVAKITPYQDHQVSGIVTFTKVSSGIKIIADVQGLPPGKHGFHVHEHGDCSGTDGMKAGGHFNPTNHKHGGPDSPERHVGDFGNLEADEKGRAYYERIDTLISFEGPNSILERSIIIHADPDDFVTQPTGNSGARIACAKIKAVKK